MFKKTYLVQKSFIQIIVCCVLCLGILVFGTGGKAANSAEIDGVQSEDIIRFHVIANSDSEEDQQLKYQVRDEILKQVAPRLAKSGSLAESRQIILGMEDELLEISREVIEDSGKKYDVSLAYGVSSFPTKSYGNIVLPDGDYEAVKIKIGKAEGANWWCVLFPPLCFVNVEESTSLPVDGKPAVPINTSSEKNKPTFHDKKIGFFLERFLRQN